MTLVTLGRLDLAVHDIAGATRRFDESFAKASSAGEMLAIVIAQHHRGWPKLISGDLTGAEDDFAEALDTSLAMKHDEGVAYGLRGSRRSVLLSAIPSKPACSSARPRLRRRTGFQNPARLLYGPFVEALRTGDDAAALDAAIIEGAELPVAEVLARVAS